jgi:hypothetical protein
MATLRIASGGPGRGRFPDLQRKGPQMLAALPRPVPIAFCKSDMPGPLAVRPFSTLSTTGNACGLVGTKFCTSFVISSALGPFKKPAGLAIKSEAFLAASGSLLHAAKLLVAIANNHTHAKSSAEVANRNDTARREIVMLLISGGPPNTVNLRKN